MIMMLDDICDNVLTEKLTKYKNNTLSKKKKKINISMSLIDDIDNDSVNDDNFTTCKFKIKNKPIYRELRNKNIKYRESIFNISRNCKLDFELDSEYSEKQEIKFLNEDMQSIIIIKLYLEKLLNGNEDIQHEIMSYIVPCENYEIMNIKNIYKNELLRIKQKSKNIESKLKFIGCDCCDYHKILTYNKRFVDKKINVKLCQGCFCCITNTHFHSFGFH